MGDLLKKEFKVWDDDIVFPEFPTIVHNMSFDECQGLGFRSQRDECQRLCTYAELAAASLLPIKGDATDFVRALTDGLARLAARLAHR